MSNGDSSKVTPPYIPWETFKNFLNTLKQSAVPNRIDPSMMPPTMSGFNKAGVTSALRFLSLIDADNKVTAAFKSLVDAYETDEWATAIKKTMLPAYNALTGDLDLGSATRHQLDEKFGQSADSMKDRSIRFYLPMLQDAGVKISPYLTARQARPRKKGPRPTTRKSTPTTESRTQSENHNGHTAEDLPAADMYQQPIPIRSDSRSFIRVPRDITTAEFQIVKSAMAVIEMMAKQREGPQQ